MATDDLLGPAQRLRGQRAALRTNLVAQAAQFIVVGQMMMLYASDVLGYSASRIATIMALAPLLVLLRLPLLGWIRRFGRIRTLLVADLLRIAVILVLLLVPAERLGFAGYLLLLLGFTLGVQVLKGAVWQSLMRDITTTRDRGQFFARMRFWFFAVTSVVTAGATWLIGDELDATEYRWLLGVVLLGLFNHLYWGQRIPDVQAMEAAEGPVRPVSLWRAVWHASLMRRPLLIALALVVMNLPIVVVYLRQGLQVPANLVSGFLLVQTLAAAGAFLFWGRIADAIGFRAMFGGLLLVKAIGLLLLVAIPPFPADGIDWQQADAALFLATAALLAWGGVSGFAASGLGIADTALQHAHVDPADSLEVLGAFSVVTVLVTAAVAYASGWYLEALVLPAEAWAWQGDLVHLDAFKIYLLGAGIVGSVVIAGLLLGVRDHRLGFGLGDFFSSLISHPITSLRQSGRIYHESSDEREALARWMGRHPNPILIDPLLVLLDDPSYDVRVEAVRSLAHTGSAEVAELLCRHLGDPARRQLWDHTAWALGELGWQPAIPRLRELAEGDYADRIRAMAVRSLGKLQDREAIPLLVGLLETPRGPGRHLEGSCCRALLRLDARDHAALLFDRLEAFEERFERYELATHLCTWLGISSRWLLRGDPQRSLVDHLRRWLTFREPGWQDRHRDVLALLEALDAAGLGEAVRRRLPVDPDPVLTALVDHLVGRPSWSPVAALAAAWLLQRPER